MEVVVLITSVSRKVWLVAAFKDALNNAGIRGKVISADIDPLSAGLLASDKYYIVPRSSENGFIPALVDICEKERVSLLVPTRDAELPVFAANKPLFEKIGTRVMVSGPDAIATCNDKYRFYRFLASNGIRSPATFLPGDPGISRMGFPLVVKSRSGSGGKGVYIAKNEKELTFFSSYVPDAIIQEFVKGKEYTIDVLSGFDGKVLAAVPRERVETYCGESYKGITVKEDDILKSSVKLAESLGTIGHITIQCIKNDEGIKFIEVNPRFGGGAALGIKSGVDTPRMLVELISGKKVAPCIGEYEEGLIMLRYTRDMFTRGDVN